VATRYLEPSSTGIRRPNDNQQMNGRVWNPPRYAEHGGATSAQKFAAANPFHISKPGGGRK
jgi:hypothetical protein